MSMLLLFLTAFLVLIACKQRVFSASEFQAGLSSASGSSSALSFRVLTHNIRYATKSPFEGEEVWSVRRPRLTNELRFNTRHIPEAFICCQEVLHEQLQDLVGDLNSRGEQWTYIGVGRDDGKRAGEYSPIFYRPHVWELLNFTTVWLSETPEVPSRGWDAASVRILTVGEFRHIQTGKLTTALNTHLDDQGSTSRLQSAKIIADRARDLSKEGTIPVFLAGDFNSEPGQEAYQHMVSETPFVDAFDQVPPTDHYGNEDTYTGFGSGPPQRLDFIFTLSSDESTSSYPWTVTGYACLANKFEDGVYSSDHRAVVVDMTLA